MTFSPGKKGGYNISDIKHGGDPTKGFGNDTSHQSHDIIYIGDTFNGSVMAFKAFLQDIQYDIDKESELEDKSETGVAVYNSYSGKIGIKISINVPSHSRNESKNNLAKITHLQKSIFQPRNDNNGTSFYKERNRSLQLVYFTNLINNGNLKGTRAPKNFYHLRTIGLPCNITEVKYEPDFSAGFHEMEGEIFPKNYKINLTLDPVTSIKTGLKYFFHPFNDNGHYSNLDSIGFPFLLKPGENSSEAKDIKSVHGSTGWLKNSDFSDIKSNISDSNTLIYISMPHNDFKGKCDDISTGTNKIRRYVAFKPFLESFNRVFSKEVVFQQDKGAAFNQTIKTKPNNKAVEYSFSFQVVSRNITEAKYNCAKIQYLMRMFYTRNRFDPTNISQRDANSIKVYIHSFIEKQNLSKRVAKDSDEAFKRAARLQFKDLNIDIDPSPGFFVQKFSSYSNLYPKAFKVTIDLVDTNKFNYIKHRANGTKETSLSSEDFNAGVNGWDIFPSKTKYWRTS